MVNPSANDSDYKLIIDKAKQNDLEICKYIDISLIKKIEDEEDIKIEEINNAIEITINIPKELINKDKKNITREYSILRSHNGEVSILNPNYDSNNETLSFKTDKFSLYSIAYKDTKIENPLTSDNITKYIIEIIVSTLILISTSIILIKSQRKNSK